MKHMKQWYGVGVALLLLFGFGRSLPLGDAAMIQIPLEDLARKADTIVVGTVTRQESAWDSHHTAIYTDITVTAERVIVGAPGAEVTFRIAGGIVGGMGMSTSNDPVFQDGERVIVFLDTTAMPGSVVGMQQGKFTVRDNTVTSAGQTVALEDFLDAIRAAAR